MKKNPKKIALEEAAAEVRLASRRIAMLHLAYARTLVEELGEEEGKKIILKAIKRYGIYAGEEVRKKVEAQGLEPTPENYGAGSARSLPNIGMHEGIEVLDEGDENGKETIRSYGCEMAKYWHEQGEDELGRYYCYVDPAKYMAYNKNYKLAHVKAMPDGDDYCEFRVVRTTEKEQTDFDNPDAQWAYIDKP